MAEQKLKRVKGFSNNGVVWPGQKDFDQDYLTIEIVKVAEKTGEGDQDYIIKDKVIKTYKPIQEVIDADASSVGVENIIKQVLRTGDTSLLPSDDGKCNVDFVGAPENLMELKQVGIDAEAKFASLPGDLTKGMDMKSFVESMTQEQFDSFIKAIADRSSAKKEVKENE